MICWLSRNWRTILVLLLWSGLNVFVFVQSFILTLTSPDYSDIRGLLGNYLHIARGAAVALNLQSALILIPVCRNLLTICRNTFLGRVVNFDKNLYFHKVIAISMAFFTVVHCIAHYFNYLLLAKSVNDIGFTYVLAWETWSGATGHVLCLCLFLLFTSATQRYRRAHFELFWFTHHLGILYFPLLIFHGYGCLLKANNGRCLNFNSYKYVAGGLFLYVVERLLRLTRSYNHVQILKVIEHPSQVFEIQFSKQGFSYKSGQYIFINVGEISWFEWHPFTLTSAPEEDYVSVHIKACGDWTARLAKRLGCFQKHASLLTTLKMPFISIDGPFGTPTEDLFKYDAAIMIGAGIGVTPFVSVLKSVWFQMLRNYTVQHSLRRLHFFWLCRDKEAFEWFQSLLEAMEEACPPGFLHIHIYLTGNLDINDVHFLSVNYDSAFDPTTFLKERTSYGRPNFTVIFESLSKIIVDDVQVAPFGKNISGKKKVGVFFCGPKPLCHSIQKSLDGLVNKIVDFEYHKEHF